MSTHFLDGRWRGEYTYGDGYEVQTKGLTVKFEMDIQFDGDVFSGTCVDDETRHLFNLPATVHGIFHDNYISIIKKYPSLVAEDEYGKLIAVHGVESPQVHFTGTLRKRGLLFRDSFAGEWEVTTAIKNEYGETIYVTGTGEWIMQR